MRRHLFNRRFLPFFLFCFFSAVMAQDPDSVTNDGLKFCISYYRDGYYNRAVECVNDVLPLLSSRLDSLLSYKYLALSYGMINRIEKAQECFRLALEKDPAMEIDTLAFPPNIALIYNQVKLEQRLEQIDTTSQKEKPPVIIREKRNMTLSAIALSCAVLSAGGAGFLFYKGYSARQEYSTIENNQALLDETWNTFIYSTIGGACCTVLCSISTFLFFNEAGGGSHAHLSTDNGGVALSFMF
jgi:tetratricopeptide (TPR) repeat protein